jgi:tRNA G18 (ribose-2'-O)-methylase SpoU
VYGANAVRELLRGDTPVTRLCLGPGPRAAELADAARTRGVRVENTDSAALERLAGSIHHQGAVAVTPPFRYAPLEAIVAPACRSALLLDGVQDRGTWAPSCARRGPRVGAVAAPRP